MAYVVSVHTAGAACSAIDTIQSKGVAGKTIGVQPSNPILCIETTSLSYWTDSFVVENLERYEWLMETVQADRELLFEELPRAVADAGSE